MKYQFDQSAVEFTFNNNGEVEFRNNGVLYRSVGQAAHDCNPKDQCQTYSAPLVCPEDPEYPEDIAGKIVWDIINPDSEDESDACNWDEFSVYF